MISIIICSINKHLSNSIAKNIDATIGVDYELIIVNNTLNESICKVYNDSLLITKYDSVCFVHEDVLFHSKNWGFQVQLLLNNKETGLVGVSGATYKSGYPAPWTCCDKSFYRNNTIQHSSRIDNSMLSYYFPPDVDFCEVVVLDGVFLAGRKDIFRRFKFDDTLLKGFHGYDIDISLAVSSEFKLVVSKNILIEHFSEGKFNQEWINDSILIHKKWKQTFPRTIGIMHNKIIYSDYLACSSFLNLLMLNNSSKCLASSYFYIILTRYFFYNRLKYLKSFLYFLFNQKRLFKYNILSH